eukprot:4404794-Amphidinium_carterae.1
MSPTPTSTPTTERTTATTGVQDEGTSENSMATPESGAPRSKPMPRPKLPLRIGARTKVV